VNVVADKLSALTGTVGPERGSVRLDRTSKDLFGYDRSAPLPHTNKRMETAFTIG